MCGEHYGSSDVHLPTAGSSPRVRGAPRLHRHEAEEEGIIPACAGSTNPLRGFLNVLRDHPRVCGEHFAASSASWSAFGSSPRVRGALNAFVASRLYDGIIPACAGSTTAVASTCAARWDHPRVCGEHVKYDVGGSAIRGSSPRVRGALALHPCGVDDGGIIPACAGSTSRA